MSAARNIQKLFVGNIPWTISSRELKHYFSEFGHVTSVIVVFDKETGLSKGYGFVGFGNQGSVSAVLNKAHHNLEGNNLVVQPST